MGQPLWRKLWRKRRRRCQTSWRSRCVDLLLRVTYGHGGCALGENPSEITFTIPNMKEYLYNHDFQWSLEVLAAKRGRGPRVQFADSVDPDVFRDEGISGTDFDNPSDPNPYKVFLAKKGLGARLGEEILVRYTLKHCRLEQGYSACDKHTGHIRLEIK